RKSAISKIAKLEDIYRGSSVLCDESVKECVFTFVFEDGTWFKVSYFNVTPSYIREVIEVSPITEDARINVEETLAYSDMNKLPAKFRVVREKLESAMKSVETLNTLEEAIKVFEKGEV
ncbi:hypothetical protein ACTHQ2_25350, partial [Bacillus subtilis]|uniref:hypothetical protein n=1 Tax=Bacillus subtilis TaxID=1423 RepID=UPI003F7C6950